MKRRIFNILAAISLVLCLATAGVWAISSRPWWLYWHSPTELGCRVGEGGLRLSSWVERSSPLPFGYFAFLGFEYARGQYIGTLPPAPGYSLVWLTVPFWFLFALTAVLPAIWLWRWRRHRRATDDGMPHCPNCDYNLTGNVSGICPECGTPIPADLVRRPMA